EQAGDSSAPPPESPPAYAPRNGSSQHLLAPQRGQSAAKRFFEAFCVALLIYALVGMLTSSMAWGPSHGRVMVHQQTGPSNDSPALPTPSDGQTSYCIGGEDWSPSEPGPNYHFPYSARTQFKYPLSSDVLYLLARGELAYGSVKIVDLEDGGDNVLIDVIAGYHSQDALNRANVCAVSRKNGENGIGIYTPEIWDHSYTNSRVEFEVIVQIPVGYGSSVLVRSLETNMPMFSHDFYFSKRVEFKSLSVRGSNMPIYAVGLHAERAVLETSSRGISGSFNVSTSLELRTSNAPIKATVGLTNDPSAQPTVLLMKTSNGPIDSLVSLISTETTKGSFNVTTKTSNNYLKVDYQHTPVDSTLIHTARTSNSPAILNLHSAYEGLFSAESSVLKPNVGVHDPHGPDPWGKHRKRVLEISYVDKTKAIGALYWGEKNWEGNGSVDVTTSNSPATIMSW
ncbi:hypothetical protein FIBSPDRAFT_769470, partial [Athelia psychrophila]